MDFVHDGPLENPVVVSQIWGMRLRLHAHTPNLRHITEFPEEPNSFMPAKIATSKQNMIHELGKVVKVEQQGFKKVDCLSANKV